MTGGLGGIVLGSVGGIGQERGQPDALGRSFAGPDPVVAIDTGADGDAGRPVESSWQEPGRLRRRRRAVAVTHPAPTLSTRPFGRSGGSCAAMTRRAAADAGGGRAPARRPRRGRDCRTISFVDGVRGGRRERQRAWRSAKPERPSIARLRSTARSAGDPDVAPTPRPARGRGCASARRDLGRMDVTDEGPGADAGRHGPRGGIVRPCRVSDG